MERRCPFATFVEDPSLYIAFVFLIITFLISCSNATGTAKRIKSIFLSAAPPNLVSFFFVRKFFSVLRKKGCQHYKVYSFGALLPASATAITTAKSIFCFSVPSELKSRLVLKAYKL